MQNHDEKEITEDIMSFEEVYKKLYPTILRYCSCSFHGELYYAEEAAAKAFCVLYRKWDELPSYEEKFLKCWLVGAARNTVKEVIRVKSNNVVSLDEEWCVAMVEQQQLQSGAGYNEVLEAQKYEDYIKEIEHSLKESDRRIFHMAVVEKCTIAQMAAEFHSSDNAMRIRWNRLQKKIRPMVEALIR